MLILLQVHGFLSQIIEKKIILVQYKKNNKIKHMKD